jgi:hypothetical protein
LTAGNGPRKKRKRQAEEAHPEDAEEGSGTIETDEKKPEDSAMDINEEDRSSIDDACELLRTGSLMEARKLVFSPAALQMLNNGPSFFFSSVVQASQCGL